MQRSPLARLAFPCLLAVALSACHPFNNSEQTMTDKPRALSDYTLQLRHNPQPMQTYRITLTLADAPGPFASIQGEAQYNVMNSQCLPPPDSNPGSVPSKLRTVESFQLTQVSANRYEGIIHADLLRDEDYIGRGVCHWQLVDVRVVLRATGADGETEFVPDIEPDAIRAEQAKTIYFWKGGYPREEIDNYSDFGATNPEKYMPDLRGELFTITLAAKQVPR